MNKMENNNFKRDLVLELHRPARKSFPRRHTILRGLSDLFQADLVEMIPYAKENNGYKYILTCINCFSKEAFCLPLKSKQSSEVARQMEEGVLKKLKKSRLPHHLQTDAGKEFLGKPFQDMLQKYNVKHYTTYTTIKAAIVERFNRTLKNKMWIEFSFQGSFKWLKILPTLVRDYNHTIHRSIGMKPINVNKKNEDQVFLKLNKEKKVLSEASKYKLGQFVRISKQKQLFSKGYHPNWSNELFKITKVGKTYPRVYHLEDLKGHEIRGAFYEPELMGTKYENLYLIEKVLKQKGNKILVKYLGFDDSENQWIEKSNLIK